MTFRGISLLRAVGMGLLGLTLVSIAAAMPLVKDWWKSPAEKLRAPESIDYLAGTSADSAMFAVSPEAIQSLSIQTGEAAPANQSRPLRMYGQFAPDTDRLVRIRPLFTSQVVQIGAAEQSAEPSLKSDPKAPPLEGTVDQILPIIEVNQRTPILRGHVENPSGWLLSNMSVTATIELPAPANEVLVPTTALVEDGRESVVFVQPDPAQPRFRPQRVAVVHRYQDVVHVRNGDRSDRPPTGEKNQDPVPLKPGARVVTAGAMELKAALEDLQARRKR